MVSTTPPSDMTAEQRCGELAAIFAQGVLRQTNRRQKSDERSPPKEGINR